MKKNIILFVLYCLTISCAYETENREKLESSFKENFGFKPPKSVKDMKTKHWGMYDTQVQWMSFTYNSKVFKKIIAHDQQLTLAKKNTSEYQNIIKTLENDAHHPNWLKIPNNETDLIFYKKDFLDHTFSEYYLWTDNETKMTFLYVQYFD